MFVVCVVQLSQVSRNETQEMTAANQLTKLATIWIDGEQVSLRSSMTEG
jgi:hypothetical protein